MLKIQLYINPTNNIVDYDFTLIGALEKRTSYFKGRKIANKYYTSDIETDNLILEVKFEDVINNDNLIGIKSFINYYDTDDKVSLKVDRPNKILNFAEADTEKRTRRNRIIDYLIAGSIGTPVEKYLSELINRYKEEVIDYKEFNKSSLKDAINNESDAKFLKYLAIKIEDPTAEYPKGRTVKDTILREI